MQSLTPKEKRCLQWAAAGKTSFEAGAILSISPRTVDYHINNVCGKFGVHSRQAAISIALELGMFPNIRSLLPKLPVLDETSDLSKRDEAADLPEVDEAADLSEPAEANDLPELNEDEDPPKLNGAADPEPTRVKTPSPGRAASRRRRQ